MSHYRADPEDCIGWSSSKSIQDIVNKLTKQLTYSSLETSIAFRTIATNVNLKSPTNGQQMTCCHTICDNSCESQLVLQGFDKWVHYYLPIAQHFWVKIRDEIIDIS